LADLLQPLKKLRLQSFNNLTKTLSFNIYDICYAQSEVSFNIYDICYAQSEAAQKEYIAYIDEAYNAARLTSILQEVSQIIGANILNIAHQDYDPQGASVTMLISEMPIHVPMAEEGAETPGPLPDAVVAHLDKSHITVHTYPEMHPDYGISTFRADIDVSTCGRISPLRALNYLIHKFESDIVIIDYRVRGFTRDVRGIKHYIDHKINSIQNFVDKTTLSRYQAMDFNVYQENTFHTKMMLREFNLNNYLFGVTETDLQPQERKTVANRLQREIVEIFNGTNISSDPQLRLKY